VISAIRPTADAVPATLHNRAAAAIALQFMILSSGLRIQAMLLL
jgi:hypothetical protein